MKFRTNHRVIWGISIPLCAILLMVGLGITYRSGTIHGTGNSKIMPWENQIDMIGTDYLLYFYNTVKGAYSQYPWVVQISYIIVALCIVSVCVLSVFMAWDIYARKKTPECSVPSNVNIMAF